MHLDCNSLVWHVKALKPYLLGLKGVTALDEWNGLKRLQCINALSNVALIMADYNTEFVCTCIQSTNTTAQPKPCHKSQYQIKIIN